MFNAASPIEKQCWVVFLAFYIGVNFGKNIPRGWYQTFAYYKGAVTGVVLYFAFALLANLLPRHRIRAYGLASSNNSLNRSNNDPTTSQLSL